MTQAESLGLSTKELVKWLEFGLVLSLGASLIGSPRDMGMVLGALLIAGAAEALYGLNQARTGTGPAGFFLGGGVLRAFGTFGQPNPFAAYLATLLSLAGGMGLVLISQARRQLVRPLGLLLLASGGLMLLAVMASLSRSAVLALGVAVGVMVALHHRRGLLLLALAALVGVSLLLLGGFGLLPPFIVARVAALSQNFALFDARAITLTSENFALVQRMAIWQAAWEMFLDHPLLGVGLGNFDVVYPRYALPGWPQLPGHAHNYYLNLLAEAGFLGLGAYLALLAYLGVRLCQAARRLRSLLDQGGPNADVPQLYGVTLGAIGLLAVLTVHHLFDNLYVHGMMTQVGLILGLGLAASEVAARAAKKGSGETQ